MKWLGISPLGCFKGVTYTDIYRNIHIQQSVDGPKKNGKYSFTSLLLSSLLAPWKKHWLFPSLNTNMKFTLTRKSVLSMQYSGM